MREALPSRAPPGSGGARRKRSAAGGVKPHEVGGAKVKLHESDTHSGSKS